MIFGKVDRHASVVLIVGFFCFSSTVFAQRLQNTSNGTLSVTLPFGTLTPGTSAAASSVSVQFRLRSNNAAGYKVQVSSAMFTPAATAPVDGGGTISAADIGVGIVSVATAPGFNGKLPRNDVITAGFAYDPGSVSGINGLTPYGGLSSGSATLQDLISNPSITILTGNKIHNNAAEGGSSNYLTVTMRFGVVRQYFTPAIFSGVIILRIVDGP